MATPGRPFTWLALFIAYVITGRLGLLLAVPPGYATAVFLPAGIAVAAMYMSGATTMIGTFLGSLVLNTWIGALIGGQFGFVSIVTALVIALASTLQAAIGGIVLRRAIGYPAAFDNPRDFLLFLLLSPIFCLTSASLSVGAIWTLGVIASADLMMNWMTWWVGDTLGVLLAIPLVLVLGGEPRRLWRSRTTSVALPMILFFGLFVAIFVRVSGWENAQSLLEFQLRSQQLSDAIRSTLEEQAAFLEQLSNSFAGRPVAVNRQDFHKLVQKLLERIPTIQAVEWAPRVESNDRPSFETAQQSDMPGFAIRERDASGELARSSDRNQFYPVTFIEPLSGNERAMGFDLASDDKRARAIGLSFAGERVVATAPIRLVQERGEQPGVLLSQAVLAGPTGPGVVLVVLRMGAFGTKLLETHQAALNLRFADAAGEQPFFDNIPASTTAAYQTEFNFGSRRYVVQTAPSAFYLAHHRGWESWAVLAAGVLGTGLIGALLLLGTGQTYRFETIADKLRTNERAMRTFNEQLESEVEKRTRERDRIWRVSEDLLGVSNFEGYFVSINPAWTKLLGWSEEQIKSMHVSELRHPDDASYSIAGRTQLAEGVPTVRMENRFRHRDGSWRWISWTMTAEDGLIYVAGRHITWEKEAAAALEQAQRQSAHLQKMEALGQLTGGIAHDFNNLLMVVGGYAQTVLRRITDPKDVRALKAIQTASSRGESLTRQLLSFSRSQPLNPATFTLVRAIDGIRDVLSGSLNVNIEISFTIPETVWPIHVDRAELELALVNLVVNARDAMPKGGRLVIAAENVKLNPIDTREGLNGDFVALSVTDTGSGIPRDILDRIFEPFFTTKGAEKGTGLGLSQIYGFSRRSGGAVVVDSVVNRGTKVTIYLPRSRATGLDAEVTETISQFVSKGNELVLVVEDNHDVRAVTMSLLEQLGYRSIAVESASEALKVLESNRSVNLVFTDVLLPGEIDGLTLARRVKDRYPEIAIILATGYAKVFDTVPEFRALRKPYEIADMARAFYEALKSVKLGSPTKV